MGDKAWIIAFIVTFPTMLPFVLICLLAIDHLGAVGLLPCVPLAYANAFLLTLPAHDWVERRVRPWVKNGEAGK